MGRNSPTPITVAYVVSTNNYDGLTHTFRYNESIQILLNCYINDLLNV